MRKTPPIRRADSLNHDVVQPPPASPSWLALHRRSGRPELGGTLVALARLAAAADRHNAACRALVGEDQP